MSTRLGMDAKLYRNTGSFGSPTWTEVTNVKDLTLNLEKGEADVTTRANGGWRATVGTLKDASIEFQMVWDTADAGFSAMQQAFFSNTPIEFAVMDGDMGDPESEGLRATFDIFNFTRNEALEEAIMVDVTIKPTYAASAPQWISGEGSSSS
jgi:predicted secreted protein